MKKFTRKEFWDIVRSHPDQERSKKIFDAFKIEGDCKSMEDIELHVLSMHEAGKEAALVVGCKCPDDVGEYSQAVYQIAQEVLGDELFNPKKAILKLPRYWIKVANLERSLARQRKCHAVKNGFRCYCDEHDH